MTCPVQEPEPCSLAGAIGPSAGRVYPTSLGSLKGEVRVLATIKPGRVALRGWGSLRGDRMWRSEGGRCHLTPAWRYADVGFVFGFPRTSTDTWIPSQSTMTFPKSAGRSSLPA